MILLILFAFLGGVVTILSPCILPILPIVLSGSIGEGKKRPLGIVLGFISSFTFFTLFLTSIVSATGVSAELLRNISVAILILFGLSMISSRIQIYFEKLFSRFAQFTPRPTERKGFFGGFLIGVSLGLVWTPCVGPILASVISLALTGSVTSQAFIITSAYAAGTAIPMFAILKGGRTLLNRVPWLLSNTGKIQKAFGVVMIATALMIYFNLDRKFQTYILEVFPNYSSKLTQLEDNAFIQKQLDDMGGETVSKDDISKTFGKRNLKKAAEFKPTGDWFNLPDKIERYTLEDLAGKVVLLDFWTYTCINCIRTLPFLREWHEKYADEGLVIVGVHTPEFEFEKDSENVAEAINDFGLEYTIFQDNDYLTWRAYNNRYWPAKYLIDKDGYISYTHFGEGKYEETEEAIVKLLKEVNEAVFLKEGELPSYDIYSRTPELYLGYRRMQYFSSPENVAKNVVTTYSYASEDAAHSFSFSGDWLISEEYSIAQPGSRLKLSFEAKNVFLVMRSSDGNEHEVRVRYAKDLWRGVDVDENNIVKVEKDRLYSLIELSELDSGTVEIEFLDGNVQVFAFTFG